MVSDSELVGRLWDILRDADLETATAASVRRRLEEQLGVCLLDRKAFIRDQIDLFLQTHVITPQNDKVQRGADDSENVKQEKNENRDSQKEGTVKEEEQEEIDDQDEKEEEEADEKSTQKAKSNTKEKDDKKRGKGFNKPCALSPQLQVLVQEPELARTEVVKRIWAYIRENNLQDPKNKKRIICDETLLGIFRVKTIDMFRMNQTLSKHIWPIEKEDVTPVKSPPKERQRKKGRDEDSDSDFEPKQEVKRQKGLKGGGTGFLAPLQLSDSLVKFFGTGENALSRGDVVKRMWKYIKENELQDPSNKRRVICDDKLRELLEVDSFEGFTMTKLLTAHFIKTAG
nr:upstream activation factor subunit spp27-like isoform X2 [Ipomoea batatas]GME11032.1 upstream activation factor subunit spp27-like isoform X2 [Ipomoea batatas]